MPPCDLLLHALTHHLAQRLYALGGEQLRLLLLQLRDDIAEQPQVRVLIAVYVANLLRRAGHLPVSGEIVEEHKAAVKIDALQNIVCHHHAQQRGSVLPLLKLVVAVPNEGVAAQQMLVRFPLVEDVIALHGGTDGVEHIAVAL